MLKEPPCRVAKNVSCSWFACVFFCRYAGCERHLEEQDVRWNSAGLHAARLGAAEVQKRLRLTPFGRDLEYKTSSFLLRSVTTM